MIVISIVLGCHSSINTTHACVRGSARACPRAAVRVRVSLGVGVHVRARARGIVQPVEK